MSHLTTHLAAEYAREHIRVRVNAIAPGWFSTELNTGRRDADTNWAKASAEDLEKWQIPRNEAGKDSEMASVCLLLATNRYLNGIEARERLAQRSRPPDPRRRRLAPVPYV